jgi:hypothetical protein
MPEDRPWDYDEDVETDDGVSEGVSTDPAEQEAGWALAREILGRNQSRVDSTGPMKWANASMGPGVLPREATPDNALTATVLGASALPLAPLLAPAAAAIAPHVPRIAGAVSGGTQGYKRGGVLGALGGAVAGAVVPTAAAAGGALEGYQEGGIPGAALGYFASGGRGGGKLLEAGKAAMGILSGGSKAAQVAEVASAAKKAADVVRTADPSKVAKLAETAQAVRKATEIPARSANLERLTNLIKPLRVPHVAGEAKAALPLADRMKESVLMWKNQNKLSGAQIQRFIRETYGKEVEGGMTMSQAGKIRDMILGGS